MRLPDMKEHCGCDDRRFIMFEAGKLGMGEAAIVALAVTVLIIGWRVSK